MEEVVVFTALAWEARAVLDGLQGLEGLGERAWRGYLGDGAPVRVLQTGVGPDRARRAAETARGARILVSVGCAGGLGAGLRAGDLVIADRVVGLDAAAVPTVEIALDARPIARWSAARGLTVQTGAVVSSPTMLATPEAKREAARYGVAVEMESAAVATVARERGIACAVVKVVLDEAADELVLPGAEIVDAETGELDVTRGVAAVALRPRSWSGALRLARQQRLAERCLRAYLAVVFSAGLDAFGLMPRPEATASDAFAG